MNWDRGSAIFLIKINRGVQCESIWHKIDSRRSEKIASRVKGSSGKWKGGRERLHLDERLLTEYPRRVPNHRHHLRQRGGARFVKILEGRRGLAPFYLMCSESWGNSKKSGENFVIHHAMLLKRGKKLEEKKLKAVRSIVHARTKAVYCQEGRLRSRRLLILKGGGQ